MKSSQPPIDRALIGSALPHLHEALERLLQAWDAVYAAERVLGFEITTMELSDLAAGLDEPASVRSIVTAEIVADWLEDVRFAAK